MMSTDAQDALLYADFVQRLLYLESVEDIQRAIREARNLDSTTLYHEFDTREQTYVKAGSSAQQKLLLFVRKVVNEIIQPQAASSVETITTADQLIERALHAPSMVHVYTLLRSYRQLLDQETYDMLQLRTSSLKHTVVGTLAWIRVTCVASLLMGSREAIAKGHFFWVSYCRDNRRFASIERHLLHAEKLAEGSDDLLMKVGIIGMRASLYDQFGQTARAAESFQQLLDLTMGANSEHLANPIRERLARCYRTLGRYQESLELISECITFTQQRQYKDQEANCHLFKGLVVEDLGRYEEGEFEYRRAAELAESLGDRSIQFRAMINIATSLQKRENAREAVASMRKTLQVVEGWGNPVMVASMRNNLGNMLLGMQQESATREALGEFMKALPTKASANDWRGEVTSYIGVGDALYALGEHDDAKIFYSMALVPALEMLERENETFGVFMYASRVASGKAALNDDITATVAWARDISRATGDVFQELVLTSLLIQQEVEQGHEQEAIAHCKEAIERCKAVNMYSTEVMRLHSGLAKLLMQHADGKQEAYTILMDAVASVEKDLASVLLNQSRAEVIAKRIELYGMLIALLVKDGHNLTLPPAADPLAMAFNLHEAAKSRAFLANLASTPIAQPASIPQELREQELELLALERDLQRAQGNQDDKSQVFRFERLRELNQQLHDCWEKMGPFAPEYVKLRFGEPATLQDVQALLAVYATTSTAFVSFFCDEDATTCFVVRSDQPQLQVFRSEIGRKGLNEAARLLRREFNGDPKAFPPYPHIRDDQPWERDLHDFEALSGTLLKFLPAVQGVELLCIAPHGPLHLLPLHALRVPDGTYLIEHFGVVYCPSLSTLRYSLGKRTQNEQRMETPSVYVAGVSSRSDAQPEFFEQDGQIFAPNCWRVTADIGVSVATKGRVLQHAGDYDVVHLTCHGYFDDKDPLNSGLLLANGQEKPPRDPRTVSILQRSQYLLTARDFLRTSMRASIVTLRACSTAIQAERNSGDELEGLSRSLLYAGNASVVVSLWNVNQQTSQQIMAKFYHYWAESGEPVEKWRALNMAQRDFLNASDKPLLSHPYHWAPLIIIGDWR